MFLSTNFIQIVSLHIPRSQRSLWKIGCKDIYGATKNGTKRFNPYQVGIRLSQQLSSVREGDLIAPRTRRGNLLTWEIVYRMCSSTFIQIFSQNFKIEENDQADDN